MIPLLLTHCTTVSALGRGIQATLKALRERQSGLQPCDFNDAKLNTFIGRVHGVEQSPITGEFAAFDCRNNRLALLGLQQDGFEKAVGDARTRYGAQRIAVILGTSTSGILETEQAYQQRDPRTGALPKEFIGHYRYTHNTFSVAHFVRSRLKLQGPALVVSTACSSSAKAFASASRLLEAGLCDAAVVGGVDSLCLTTLYGFSSLELASQSPCRPGDAERDGLSIGEAAAFILVEKCKESAKPGDIALLGYGESCDAYHMSHPHPSGAGAILAMQGALSSANVPSTEIDYVHLHGTATKANDQTEDQAVTRVFGSRIPCSSTKGWTGHTLGAAGGIESVIAALCLEHQFLPGTLNTKTVDPSFTSNLLLDNQERPVKKLMSNFFGFGGNNCSLLFGTI
jgi:3-oxoacyl-[acyl-carrier-protein] synthase-1